ncbi:MAG TPA: DUF1904 domain-containing protein [Selenomonadales bacterium]|nr:DUF1904 domain-containing protein [Selenomonadales bacterium]
MPQIIIRGMDEAPVKAISGGLVDELTEIVGCPRDYFTIELLPSIFIADGKAVEGTPFVQVNWFDRGQAVQDRAAAAIDRHIRGAGYRQTDIFFLVLQEQKYYENGRHY